MKTLIAHYSRRRDDPFFGTPAESFPMFDVGMYSFVLEDEQLDTMKAKITQEHTVNIRGTTLETYFPRPVFREQEYNLTYEI